MLETFTIGMYELTSFPPIAFDSRRECFHFLHDPQPRLKLLESNLI